MVPAPPAPRMSVEPDHLPLRIFVVRHCLDRVRVERQIWRPIGRGPSEFLPRHQCSDDPLLQLGEVVELGDIPAADDRDLLGWVIGKPFEQARDAGRELALAFSQHVVGDRCHGRV